MVSIVSSASGAGGASTGAEGTLDEGVGVGAENPLDGAEPL